MKRSFLYHLRLIYASDEAKSMILQMATKEPLDLERLGIPVYMTTVVIFERST
jgi:hypothetical protein